MKGLWFVEKGKTAFVEEDRPTCQPNTVLLKTWYSGLSYHKELVRDVVPIVDAVSIYDMLRDEKQKLLGTVFDWTGDHGFG